MEDTKEVKLSLNDLQTIVNVIDTSCARGGFRGDEMFSVGSVRQKVVDIIQNTRQKSALPPKEDVKNGS